MKSAVTLYSLNEFAATGDSSYDTERDEHTAYNYADVLYLARQHVKSNKTAAGRKSLSAAVKFSPGKVP